jgi:hypothetical protein
MRSIKDIHNLRQVKGDVGVEIEVEGEKLPARIAGWRVEADPSLRGEQSAEYVLASPVPIGELSEHLATLKAAFVKNNARFDDTYRAGVHVHVNVQHFTLKELFNFIVLVMVVEELLLTFCAKHRIGNHFCLRSSEAGYLPNLLLRTVKEQNINLLHTDDIRYSAMNLKPIATYGSIEFRALESTYDFDKINKWAEILVHLRDVSKEFTAPQKIMEEVSAGGYDGFVRKVFGDNADLFMAQKDWQQMIRKGIINAQDLAYSRIWGINLNIFARNKDW